MRLREFPDRQTFKKMAESHNVIPVCAEILADTETPVSLLQKIYQDKGPVFLLESVEGGEKWGRYSFLGISARAHVRIFKSHVEIEAEGRSERVDHGGDPFAVLRNFMADFNPAHMAELPRFWGGLVGYFSYETVSFFERIPVHLKDDTAMGHFVIPDQVLIFDNIRNTLMMVAIAFTQGPEAAEAVYDEARGKIAHIRDLLKASAPERTETGTDAPLMLESPVDEAVFRDQVSKVIDYIRQGEVIQTVISQPFVCRAPGDILALYRAQRFINPSPYLYFMHLDGMTLVGSSPETMVRLENREATLRPIAGTRPRGKTEQEDRALANELLGDEKERAEHLMLVDLGRNDLGRIGQTGSVQVTDLMFVERYSHVMHLVSNITCDLKPECDAWDLFRATFPAGTLSGAPKVRAMEIIAEIEQAPRGPYGGAVGYISFHGNMDMAITIRTACIEEGKLTVRAGAGIVADSVPENERMETVNKAMAIQKALKLLNNQRATEEDPS